MAALTRSGHRCPPTSTEMERGGEGSGRRRRAPTVASAAGGVEIAADGVTAQNPGSVGIWPLLLSQLLAHPSLTRQLTRAGFCRRQRQQSTRAAGQPPPPPELLRCPIAPRLVLLQVTISSPFAYLYTFFFFFFCWPTTFFYWWVPCSLS